MEFIELEELVDMETEKSAFPAIRGENGLPEGWEINRLGEVCKAVTGTTPPKNDISNYGEDIPFVKPPQLIDKPINNAPEKLSLKGANLARVLPANSVLVTCIGNLGRTAINNIPVAFNQQINALIPSEKLDSRFLFYQAQSPQFRNQLENLSAATTVAIVNKGKFETINIAIPHISEQQKIVSKIEELFSELDKGKQQLETAREQLKIYRQSVLKWAFEGKLTNSSTSARIELTSNDLPGVGVEPNLPEGWKWVSIDEVAEINPKISNRENISDELEIQFLPMKLVEEVVGKIHLTETRKYGEVKKGYTPFINGDVIFAKVTPCMENGKIAVVENLKNSIGFGSSEFHVVRVKEQVLSHYLFYFLVQERFRKEAENSMTGAVGLRRVPKQFIENYQIPLPHISEQQKIVEEIESRLSVADKVEETISQSLQQAETLRQSILKQAFEGKLV